MRNLSEISNFIDEIEERHNISKRIDEINRILEVFREKYLADFNTHIEYIPNAAVVITYFYFFKMEQEIKGYLENNSNEFKMASGTEQVINYVQPVASSDTSSKTLRQLNTELAVYSAHGFIAGWNDIEYYLGSGIESLNDAMDNFLNERIKILSSQNLNASLPILFHSQSWELFYLMHHYFRSAATLR